MKRPFIVVFCALTALALRAERFGFERYQPIVDRQMFGPLPEGFDPARPPSEVQKTGSRAMKELTKEQEQVKKSVKFSMINLNPAGETMVGFTDNSNPKEVRHYYLRVGETRDGWTVKAADAVAATVSISKDGVDLDLELGTGGGAAGGAAGGSGTAVAAGGGPRRGGLGLFGGGRQLGRLSGTADSLRERRKARLQQLEESAKAEAEARAKRDAEAEAEKAKAEEDRAQREAEREQQREQLLQIQEELKRAREARQAAERENAEQSATAEE